MQLGPHDGGEILLGLAVLGTLLFGSIIEAVAVSIALRAMKETRDLRTPGNMVVTALGAVPILLGIVCLVYLLF
jgi:F0F1-type ATP synthase membrane subunit c/vacuolar-type H+-ATPase subunit K